MRVHLDHNATTPLRPEVRELLAELESERAAGHLGNPSSLHASGRRARQLIDEARERTAAALGVPESGVVFTSGGTEANATALAGTLARERPWRGLVTAATEHSAVLEPARALRRAGRPLWVLPVDATGVLEPARVATAAADPRVALVSVMAANNEIGTVQPLDAIGAALEELGVARPVFHTDAVQTPGKWPVRPREWGVDLASFSAHKAGGPVGVGVLAVMDAHARPEALLRGGSQEGGLRAGTEDAIGIAGAALAFELACAEQPTAARKHREWAQRLWTSLRTHVPDAVLNGPAADAPQRLPNTLNVQLPDADGRVLVTRLDLEGLEVSAGSACASGAIESSHVLRALGRNDDDARAGLRVSFGWSTREADVQRAVELLARVAAPSRA